MTAPEDTKRTDQDGPDEESKLHKETLEDLDASDAQEVLGGAPQQGCDFTTH